MRRSWGAAFASAAGLLGMLAGVAWLDRVLFGGGRIEPEPAPEPEAPPMPAAEPVAEAGNDNGFVARVGRRNARELGFRRSR